MQICVNETLARLLIGNGRQVNNKIIVNKFTNKGKKKNVYFPFGMHHLVNRFKQLCFVRDFPTAAVAEFFYLFAATIKYSIAIVFPFNRNCE